MANELENRIVDLVATDRLYIPSSSFDGKLERSRPKIALEITGNEYFSNSFEGDRAYARVVETNKRKARGMRDGVEEFSKRYPQYGKILNGIIEEERVRSEKHLYFGMNEGKKVAHDDYISVLKCMGMSEGTAENYCKVAIEISRNLQKKRPNKQRSVLVKD